MADLVIGATVQVLLEKLISLTIEEVNSSRDFNKDLEMLTQNVSLIQAFIHDVETPQVEKQQSVEQWLNRLERVAEDAENVFDRFRYESLKTKVMSIRNSPMKKVSGFFSHTAFKRKMSQKIHNINKELTAINKLAKDLGLQSLMVPSRKILPIRETDSLVVASDVVGRDNDVDDIKQKILKMREEDVVLCTIPIVEVARTAYLQEKSNIYKLAYVWFHDEPEGSETNDEYVLDGLQPHPNLKTLAVVDYLGTKFPSWFRENLLPNLVRLKLSCCKRCKEIPSLGQLKLLRHLELLGFHEVESIGPRFYGIDGNNNGSSNNIQVFPSLKELTLEDMSSLIEWKGDEIRVRLFPELEKLSISNCPLLKSAPSQFEILHELSINSVDSEMPLLNLCSNLTSLVGLSVYAVKELTCFPDEMLRNNISLQNLMVSVRCKRLQHLDFSDAIPKLRYVDIRDCPLLKALLDSLGNLVSLEELSLCNCRKLEHLPSRDAIQRLTKLWDAIVAVPFEKEYFNGLTCLACLSIRLFSILLIEPTFPCDKLEHFASLGLVFWRL
ncbi:hypothetical protein H5410_053285 [Solanum commersonii]|uniref:Rx N-terminal domain-containing protein n=1 Tax=Solanum commersonii TaxID=4109 RepID=A0A9J5X400_SOLCO|nr:hypothetical protein H5410_053285 [Solanum commersonii]